jgi:phosphatidylinositol glycan class O
VSDLDSVDNCVIENVEGNLNRSDWTLMVGHLLGVDHVGHTFDATSEVIEMKLE